LAKDGITVFITTAYLDEAERCNRLGLMDHGRLIRCDTPDALKHQMEEVCYEVQAPNQRAAKQVLQSAGGVVSVELSGASLHLFLSPAKTSVEALQNTLNNQNLGSAVFRPIVPSLEDVFIAMIHKSVGQVPDLPPKTTFRIPEAQ
jgi:ABC-2 type transport system ATP-binding protein